MNVTTMASNVFLIVLLGTIQLEFGMTLRRFYMEDKCSGTINMESAGIPAGRLSVTRRSKYRSTLSCHVTIVAPPERKIIVVFREMDIEWEQNCDDDFVTFHNGPTMLSAVIAGIPKRMCGHKPPTGSFVTTGNSLTVFFQSDLYKQENGFEIVFTSFHKSDSCFIDEMRCDNGRCIAVSLHCNDFDNCGDGSDECQVNSEVLVAIVLSVFLLTVVAIGSITLYRKRKRKHNDKKMTVVKATALEYISRSSGSPGSIDIIPCENCAFKIVSSEKEKLKREKGKQLYANQESFGTHVNHCLSLDEDGARELDLPKMKPLPLRLAQARTSI